jgi:O-antigen/teichoic acid export membrane protein
MSVFKKINSLINNQGAMMYLKNTSWLLFEKILKITAGLFIGIWVARYLGPEDFGEFSFALSFVGLFVALATLGLDGIVIRNLVNNQNQRNQILGSAFFLKFIGSILVLLLITTSTTFF